MCGIVGYFGSKDAATKTYLSLLMLQHRGQDSAGIYTSEGTIHKGLGLIQEVFDQETLENMTGEAAIGHVRYATIANDQFLKKAQPFKSVKPYAAGLVHNGNIINKAELREIARIENEDITDSEVLLFLFLHYLNGHDVTEENLFAVVEKINKVAKGSYSVIILLPGYGMLAFRDPKGIRPLILGKNKDGYVLSSESRSLYITEAKVVRDVEPGEAIFISDKKKLTSKICSNDTALNPCIFEFIYLSMPDSIFQDVTIYEARYEMGRACGKEILKEFGADKFDVIVPIPLSGKAIASGLADELKLPYSDILVNNKHINRTFILSSDIKRQNAIKQKFSLVKSQIKGKRVCLVDDSIVRGSTSKNLSKYFRECGASEVHYVSAAPEIRYPNTYGIFIPTQKELVAYKRNLKQIAKEIGADSVYYLPLEKVHEVIQRINPNITGFEESMFTNKHLFDF